MFVFRQDEFKESKIAIEKLSKLGLHTIGKPHSKLSSKQIFLNDLIGAIYIC